MNKTLRTLLIVFPSFIVYYLLSKQFKSLMSELSIYVPDRLLYYLIAYIIVCIPVFMGTALLHRSEKIFRPLGLSANILLGLLVAILFTLPMFLGGVLLFSFDSDLEIRMLLIGTLFAGFFEELIFRGFLFGQLYRYSKLGFIPSVVIGAIVFSLGHLYQSNDDGIKIGIFLITFLGSGFFAWLFVEWKYNLWVPIFMHTLMNLSWMIFDMSEHAMGGLWSNILRALTIALAIVGTIRYKRKKGLPFEVNKQTLLVKR